MKTTVNFTDFQNAFRAIRPNNFTYEGLKQLFDYLEACENDTGKEFELDVIAFCCEYNEDSPENIARDYNIDLSDIHEDKKIKAVIEFLCDSTFVIGHTNNTIIYQQF